MTEQEILSLIDTPQPPPIITEKSIPVSGILKALIDRRTDLGIQKYGIPLHSHAGRVTAIDALQEAVDLIQYLCQVIIEQQVRLAEKEEE